MDFHKTLLKRGKWLPAAFQNSYLQILEMFQPMGREALHSYSFNPNPYWVLILHISMSL
jgi:hypothetical protein